MQPKRSSILAGIALVACSSLACGTDLPESKPDLLLGVAQEDSAGVPTLELSHTLREVARGDVIAQEIAPELVVGDQVDDEDVWFGGFSDLSTAHDDGGFTAVDHLQNQLLVFGASGELERRVGREGDGPGEFRRPWMIANVGGHWVVRQNSESPAFTVFDSLWNIRTTVPAQPEGDWSQPMFRRPDIRMGGFQMGPEDVSRRLQPFGDSSFVHMLQVNEATQWDYSNPVEFEALPTYLIRYSLDGIVLDTLAVMAGPPTRVDEVWAGRTIFYSQPLFSGRPVWATGRDWYAIGHGDSTQVAIYDLEGQPLLKLALPKRRRAVSLEDRQSAANWMTAATLNNTPSSMQRAIRDGPRRQMEVQEFLATDTPFADSIPHVTALYGAGPCLFLSGFDSGDWADGTALSLVVVDVHRREVLTVIRIRPPTDGALPEFPDLSEHGSRVVHLSKRFLFTARLTREGSLAVERFRLPIECDGGVGAAEVR